MQIVLKALDDAADETAGEAQDFGIRNDSAAQCDVYAALHRCQHLNDGGLLGLDCGCYLLAHDCFLQMIDTKSSTRRMRSPIQRMTGTAMLLPSAL